MPAAPFTRTRIAPTPSGYLHLGNVLSFTITAALAQKHNAKIFLRIDDIDQARANREYVKDIFDTLNFLDIPWHEGPKDAADFEANYSQMQRLDNYAEALNIFREKDLVFACTCSRRQVDKCNCADKNILLDNPEASWRLRTTDKEITVNNYDGQLITSALPEEMRNFIVRKRDGYPAYQLTSVVDDILFNIDMVVRGEDLWASTLAQYALAESLGIGEKFGNIAFYHHPLIKDPSGQKLSKSAGATSIKYLRESGKSAEGVYALIADILGLKTNVTGWQQLGDSVLMKC